MERKPMSRLKKGLIITGVSATVLGGGLAIEHYDGPKSEAADDLEFVSELGLVAGAYQLTGAGAEALFVRAAKKEYKRFEELDLPRLQKPLSARHLIDALNDNSDLDGERLHRLLINCRAANQVVGHGFPDSELYVYEALYEDVSKVVSGLVEHYHSRENDDSRALDALYLSWFLDRAAPIADDCTRTPQTEDPGKFWFDYIQSQAFRQSDELLAAA